MTITGIAAIAACRVVLAIAEMVIQLAFQGALDHHLGQPAQQPALTGQLQPAGAGPLGKLAQHLLVGRGEPAPAWSPVVTSVTGVSFRLRSYTIEIYSPFRPFPLF